MRNIKSNHSGLAGWNLWLSNTWTMNKYYFKNRKKIEYPINWPWRIRYTIKAIFLGWDFKNMKTEKRYLKKFER